MTRQPVCLILTRPLWQGAQDTLAAELLAVAHRYLPPSYALRLISAPLQRLIPSIDAPDLPEHIGPGMRLLVATSPASVEALAALPVTGARLAREIAAAPGRWALTGVGAASCGALSQWLEAQDHGISLTADMLPEVWRMPVSMESGAEPFLHWLAQYEPPALKGLEAVLLESQENQPRLADGLFAMGIPSQRLFLYRRAACPMPLIRLGNDEVLGVLVSSSTLVGPAIEGLRAQSIDPRTVVWITHHRRIAEALTASIGAEIRPLVEGLGAAQILSGMARLNFGV